MLLPSKTCSIGSFAPLLGDSLQISHDGIKL